VNDFRPFGAAMAKLTGARLARRFYWFELMRLSLIFN
jgi:hypothetical protein